MDVLSQLVGLLPMAPAPPPPVSIAQAATITAGVPPSNRGPSSSSSFVPQSSSSFSSKMSQFERKGAVPLPGGTPKPLDVPITNSVKDLIKASETLSTGGQGELCTSYMIDHVIIM